MDSSSEEALKLCSEENSDESGKKNSDEMPLTVSEPECNYTDLKNDTENVSVITEEAVDQIILSNNMKTECSSEILDISISSVEVDNSSQEKSHDLVPVENKNINVEENEDSELKSAEIVENAITDEIKVVGLTNDVEKLQNKDEGQWKNFKNVILKDWEVEVPQIVENHVSEAVSSEALKNVSQSSVEVSSLEKSVVEVLEENPENVIIENEEMVKNSEADEQSVSSKDLEGEFLKIMEDTKADSLKYSKSISKNEIVKILDESSERVVKPIVAGKDLFFSIELTKRLNQKLMQNKSAKNPEPGEKSNSNENELLNNNNLVDDRQKIVDILEADEIKDWKSVPNKSDVNPKENDNDMEISKAIKSMEESGSVPAVAFPKVQRKTPKKMRTMDKELERSIALQQLREEFPTTRKRSKTMKKINHIPFLASTVLEKAMTSPEVTTALKPGPPKRRPCYLPDNNPDSKGSEGSSKTRKAKAQNNSTEVDANSKSNNNADTTIVDLEFDGSQSTPMTTAVVKTYSAKRKSTDGENEIRSTLETIAAVRKALSHDADEASEFKPKKQKTVTKSDDKISKKLVRKKTKPKIFSKRRNLELEKLLGDEGAVRMLYDTQQRDASKKERSKTAVALKKDLVLKKKLVKNAVMRLSGVGTEGIYLRRKRFSKVADPPEANSEPLFASTPNVVFYKSKKKQRAEASRILYRHSSSESFDSSEGYRRTSFDGVDSVAANKESPFIDGETAELPNSVNASADAEKISPKAKSKRRKIFIRRKLNAIRNSKPSEEKKEGKASKSAEKSESSGTDSVAGSKLNLSKVPVRKSSRSRTVSKKYSIWSSTSMDSLSAEALGLKKWKKGSPELGKKLNCKELTILQYEYLVQVILNPCSTLLKNSLNLEVLQELKHVFSFLSDEESCRVVLLSSTGSTFCQGIDINQIVSYSDEKRKNGASQLAKAVENLCICLASFKKPLAAGVQGAAIGLGVTLLPYCDLVVASDNASFYTPYVKLGQAPEGAATYTFPRISRQLVSELLFQSRKMTAADALKHGLVSRLIPEEKFDDELMTLARNMATQPSQGIQSTKLLLRSHDLDGILKSLKMEGKMLEEHWTTAECLNNMIKFFKSGELQLKHSDHT